MSSVSHSRVESFLRCPRQEYYAYALKLEKVAPSVALALGSAGHSCLAVLYSHVLSAGMSIKKQRAAYPEAVNLMWEHLDKLTAEGFTDSEKRAPLRLILESYLKHESFIDREWADDKRPFLIMAVEKEFNLQYDDETGASYPFVIDLIVKDPDGFTVVVDHKFVYDFMKYELACMKPQIPKYMGALRALGYKVGSYGIYNMLRTRPNTKAGRPPEEWVFAMDMEVTSTRVQRTFLEQVEVALQVQALDELDDEERDLRAVRCGNDKTCEQCDFLALCSEELRGGNTALLMSSAYRPKKKRDGIEISLEVD